MRKLILVLVAALAALAVVSCASLATDREIADGIGKADESAAAAAAAADSATEPEQRAAALAAAEEFAATAAGLRALRDRIDAESASASDATAAIQTIGGLVPGVGTAIGYGAGAIAAALGLAGTLKWRRVARQIIDGLEAAQRASPELAAEVEAATPTIHAAMDLATIGVVRSELSRRRAASGRPARASRRLSKTRTNG